MAPTILFGLVDWGLGRPPDGDCPGLAHPAARMTNDKATAALRLKESMAPQPSGRDIVRYGTGGILRQRCKGGQPR